MTDTPTPTPLPRLLKQREVRELVGMSRTRFWQLEQTADAPPRATGLNGAVRYAEDEVRAWLEKRKRADHSKAA